VGISGEELKVGENRNTGERREPSFLFVIQLDDFNIVSSCVFVA
jgi:hypothetical protein